ncbi:hypothetical protein [Bifidobacterium pseudolongum]|jgi:hypothetical protein|uniref:hypothetical protein n=1 Tax=Bifidobacterium pseudolongum TaxID=1694 RepID=UPI001C3D632C|nr:hypothetical protein [Bifidobacterium pseudolongum]
MEERVGKYSIITTGEFEIEKSDVLMLDSNLLIDIDKFYYMGISRPTRESLRELLYRARNIREIDFYVALRETCIKRENRDLLHAKRMIHAAKMVWDKSDGARERMFANRHPPVKRDKRWQKGKISVEEGEMVPEGLPEGFWLFYGSFLHLIMLYEQIGARQREELFVQHCQWTRNELSCVAAYPRMVARSLLLGKAEESNRARALLKVDKKNIPIEDKAWNAAWDCYFMSILDGYRMGSGNVVGEMRRRNPMKVALATAKDQAWIDSISSYRGALWMGDMCIPFVENMSGVREDAMAVAEEQAQKDNIVIAMRLGDEHKIKTACEAISNLESDLGIAHPVGLQLEVESFL